MLMRSFAKTAQDDEGKGRRSLEDDRKEDPENCLRLIG